MPPRVRPPLEDDAGSVLQVIVARDVADLGVPDFTLDDLRADWATPGLDLEHDVARRRRGRLDPRLRDPARRRRAWSSSTPRPRARATGTVLRRWAEARASERGTAVLRQFAYGANDRARRLLREAGYAPAQHYFRLRADLAEVPGPADVSARVSTNPTTRRRSTALIEDAFTEIEGVTPMTLEEWRAKGTAKAGHDPRLWLIAEDEDGLAGAALGERWENGTGYVAELAVAARARGRGLGRALLLGLFAAFRRAGLTHAELSVHGRNRGALASVRVRRHALDLGGRALGEGPWTRLTSPAIAERAREAATARARHGVHARGALPAAALPGPGRGRRGGLGARPAGGLRTGAARRRARRPGDRDRGPRRPPGRRDPAPRVGDRRRRTCSTPRWRRASPASRPRPATTACCTTS